MKQLGSSVKCKCSNHCLRGSRRRGVRAPTCSAVTMSWRTGPEIQTARGERPDAIAIWEVYTHTLIETEEISYSKAFGHSPIGLSQRALALTLRQEMFHHYQAALWPSRNPQISIPWTCTSFKKETGKKLAWKLGFTTLSQDSHDTHLLTAFPSPFSIKCSTLK